MAYDISDVEFHQWGADSTLGSTAITHFIVGPKGKVGFVRDIMIDVTTALVGTTTVPEINVGISAGDATYGRYRLGSTASLGYAVGPHRASQEAITGNPPRALADYAGHVVLDGGPLTSSGIAGGSYGTVVPKGRIPASGFTITNVILGTVANSNRVFLNGMQPAKDLILGQSVTVAGVVGVNATENGVLTIAAIDPNFQWVELTTQTFSGAYTSGGIMFVNVVVSSVIGVGAAAGGGHVKVKIEWLGAETV